MARKILKFCRTATLVFPQVADAPFDNGTSLYEGQIPTFIIDLRRRS